MTMLLGTLSALLLAAHLMCVNVAAAGPLLAIWLDRRGRRLGDSRALELSYRLAALCWQGALAGGLLGLLGAGLMWLLGYRTWFAALGQIPDYRLHWLAAELAVFLLLMLPFAPRWAWHPRRPWLRYLCGLLAATNLLYHFPPMFVILSKLATEAEWIGAVPDRRDFYRLLLDPQVLSRTAHHWLAACSTAGLLVCLLAARGGNPAAPLIRGGAGIALGASLLQIPVGLWVLLALPAATQSEFLGGDLAAGGLLLVSVLLTVGLLQQLAMITLGDTSPRMVRTAIVLLVAVIVLMTAALQRSKHLDYRRLPDADVALAGTGMP